MNGFIIKQMKAQKKRCIFFAQFSVMLYSVQRSFALRKELFVFFCCVCDICLSENMRKTKTKFNALLTTSSFEKSFSTNLVGMITPRAIPSLPNNR